MRPGSTTQQSRAASPAGFVVDPLQDAQVLLERVGVECRHHAAHPPVAHADEGAARAQAVARPAGLVERGRARDQDVRPEAPAIDAQHLDHPGRQDRERQHVIALTVIAACVAHELHARPGGGAHELARACRVPRPALDAWLTVVAQRSLEAEQPVPEASGDDPPGLLAHVHEPIAGDALLVHVHDLQPLAPQRLDGVAPQLRHLHRHTGSVRLGVVPVARRSCGDGVVAPRAGGRARRPSCGDQPGSGAPFSVNGGAAYGCPGVPPMASN